MRTCSDCGNARPKDCARCDDCRARHNARERLRRAERKRKRQCWACGEKAVKGKSVCKNHEGTEWRVAS